MECRALSGYRYHPGDYLQLNWEFTNGNYKRPIPQMGIDSFSYMILESWKSFALEGKLNPLISLL